MVFATSFGNLSLVVKAGASVKSTPALFLSPDLSPRRSLCGSELMRRPKHIESRNRKTVSGALLPLSSSLRANANPNSLAWPNLLLRLPSPRRASENTANAAKPERQEAESMSAIELELFRQMLGSIADEMGIVLRKTAYSANIKERRDYSCAVYDRHGQTVAMGEHMPVHLGAMPLSVDFARQAFRFSAGDVVILNDPFRGGTHLPDITAVSGVFLPGDKTPSFYVANRAHHADVGGMSPGSMPLAQEIFQEGIRIPPTLLRARKARYEEMYGT